VADGRERGRDCGRLVALGWWAAGTGLTRVLQEVLRELAADWRVDVAGIRWPGEERADSAANAQAPYQVHTTANPADRSAAYLARDLCSRLSPRVVFVLHDVWTLGRYAQLIRPAAPGAALVAYVPLDGEIVDPEEARGLLGWDLVVVYTEWAAAQVRGAWDALGEEGPPLAVVGHGVDCEAFRPAPELAASGLATEGRAAAKRRLFSRLPLAEESYVVLNASRPTPRKRLDLTLAGFAQFARDKPDTVRVCLHLPIHEPEHLAMLRGLAEVHGIGHRLVLNPFGEREIVSDEELDLLYNACDLGLNTSMGEGWGLVSFEHAAAGAPQVVPRHSACAELWEGSAEMVEPARRFVPRFSPLRLAELDATDVARALDAVYRDPARQRRLAEAGLELVGRDELRWGSIGARWRELIAVTVEQAAERGGDRPGETGPRPPAVAGGA